MSESITVRCGGITDAQDSAQIIALLNQVVTDIANLRTAINAHQHTVVTSAASGTWTSAVSTYTQSATNLLP
jgi:hypothetical protein